MLIVLTACSLDQDHLAEEQDRMLEEEELEVLYTTFY